MGNDIRDSTGTNEEHSSLKLSVYSTFISKLDKTLLVNYDLKLLKDRKTDENFFTVRFYMFNNINYK